jgi:hypothetical protein
MGNELLDCFRMFGGDVREKEIHLVVQILGLLLLMQGFAVDDDAPAFDFLFSLGLFAPWYFNSQAHFSERFKLPGARHCEKRAAYFEVGGMKSSLFRAKMDENGIKNARRIFLCHTTNSSVMMNKM